MHSGILEYRSDTGLIKAVKADQPARMPVHTHPNEFVLLRESEGDKPVVARTIDQEGTLKQHVPVKSMLPSRNKEQSWAYELLYDSKVQLVTLTGPAGTGKTLLALAAGKQQLGGEYEKLIVARPIVPMGKDIGYLPGTIEEKMEPWIAPIKDNLMFLSMISKSGKQRSGKQHNRDLRYLMDHGIVEIEALPYIRGRTLPNAFILIDEAQNMDLASLKTVITRAGEGSKIVLTGDLEQIDAKTIDKSGLEIMIERFRPYEISGHISLIKGERSELATLASRIL